MKTIKRVVLSVAIMLGLAVSSSSAGTNDPIKISNNDCSQLQDLKVEGEFDHDWLGESELRGSIINNSLYQEYEDAMVNIRFYDDDHILLGSKTLKIDKELDRGETENFKLEFDTPSGTESADWAVVCAEEE